jgi:predicted nucleic acid-binding protein
VILYLDTSFLLKLYIFESDSKAADDLLPLHDQPIISWLSEIEMASALTAKFAETIAGRAAEAAYHRFRFDLRSDLFAVVPLNEQIYTRARNLAESYGPKYRVRALDILHVAVALEHHATAFGTFDRRQALMAADEGLNLLL